MPGMILQIDDLEVGMFVTIHSGQVNEVEEQTISGNVITRQRERYDWLKGRVLRIIEIQFPFIVAERFVEWDKDLEKKIDSFDMRECKFMKISNAYVKALTPLLKIK